MKLDPADLFTACPECESERWPYEEQGSGDARRIPARCRDCGHATVLVDFVQFRGHDYQALLAENERVLNSEWEI